MIRVGTVVEGHGEVKAFPVLLRRMALHWRPSARVVATRPFRLPRTKLHHQGALDRALKLQALDSEALLVLMDADDDLACELGPRILARARTTLPHKPMAVVFATREYEAWFLAAADSLAGAQGLPENLVAHQDPEGIRDAKGWLGSRMRDGYKPTLHQAAFSARLDLDLARERSPSFDKLARDLLRLIDEAARS